MMRSGWLRLGFYIVVGLVFLGSLLGILITGPVVVRLPRYRIAASPSPARLLSTVEKLCTEFAPRSYRHVENLDRTADWIAGHFRESGLETTIQEYTIEPGVYRNVIARRPGLDPDAGAVVIGAHYDLYGETPGADDNASGVAVLLELVRTLPRVEHKRTHYFAAFSTEEPPLFGTTQMGSHVFATELKQRGVDVRLMVSLDTVGFYSDEAGSQQFPSAAFRLYYPGKGNFAAVIGDLKAGAAIEWVKRGMRASGDLPVYSLRAPMRLGVVHLSDHYSFRQLGFQAVQVTDTAFMRYAYYHDAEDTPEKLDYERMTQLVTSLHGVLWEGD